MVHNLPEIVWPRKMRERPDWCERLMDELAHLQPQPYLVDIHTLEITQGDLVVWKASRRHRIQVPRKNEPVSLPPIPKLSLHGTCTVADVVAALGGGEFTTWCDGQFIRLANLTLLIASTGGLQHGLHIALREIFPDRAE